MLAWDDLRYVLAVADAGSLAGAGRALKVSHPTVLRRIVAIERRIGAPLFQRRPDGHAITPAGEEIRDLARRVQQDVLALEHRLAGRDLRPGGSVRLTAPDTVACHLLPPIAAAIRAAHPAIVLDVVVANEFLSLTRREADIAIRPTKAPPESLVGRRVAVIRYGIFASRERFGAVRNWRESAGQVWIGFDEALAHLEAARWMARHVNAGQIIYRTNTLPAMLGAARAGLGLALLPLFLGRADEGLVRLGPLLADLDTPLWLLTHRDLRDVPRIRAVLDMLAAALRSACRS